MSETRSSGGSPPTSFSKKGAETKRAQSGGSKVIKTQRLSIGEPSDIGPAPAHRRLYMRDYSKTKAAPSDTDLVTGALGNPLKY
jgi:hypothetical protein